VGSEISLTHLERSCFSSMPATRGVMCCSTFQWPLANARCKFNHWESSMSLAISCLIGLSTTYLAVSESCSHGEVAGFKCDAGS